MIQEETIKTQYGNIAAYKKGAGSRNVLLLHGAGCDSTMLSWREVFNTFSDDYSVYAFDFLGYGNSDRADDLAGDSFFDTHIECVKTVVSYYGLTDFFRKDAFPPFQLLVCDAYGSDAVPVQMVCKIQMDCPVVYIIRFDRE